MGCTHSRSEDLYKKSILNSESFMGSISETPGYFSRTAHTLDFVESKFPNSTKTEMSYTGPPSHLQNSIDVHPFWSEFGREFEATDRYHDMTNGSVPRSLLPGTDTAQEMRNLELKESLQDLRSQVKAKMAQARPIPEEETEDTAHKHGPVDDTDSHKALNPPPQPPPPPPSAAGKQSVDVPAKPQGESGGKKDYAPVSGFASFQDEKAALDLLDSVISESMDFDNEDDVSTHPETIKDNNWSLGTESFMKVELRRRNKDNPVPGVMHEVAPVGTRNSMYSESEPVSNGAKNVLRSSMYLPDTSYSSPQSMAAMSVPQQPLLSYRVEAASSPNPLHMENPVQPPLGTGISSNSTDTGFFSDGGTTNSASSNDSGLGSGGTGVQDLVKIYNEQSKVAADRAWKRQSANLDNLGKPSGGITAPPLERRLSQPENLPLDDSVRVPRNSAILDEIRAELQMQLSN